MTLSLYIHINLIWKVLESILIVLPNLATEVHAAIRKKWDTEIQARQIKLKPYVRGWNKGKYERGIHGHSLQSNGLVASQKFHRLKRNELFSLVWRRNYLRALSGRKAGSGRLLLYAVLTLTVASWCHTFSIRLSKCFRDKYGNWNFYSIILITSFSNHQFN